MADEDRHRPVHCCCKYRRPYDYCRHLCPVASDPVRLRFGRDVCAAEHRAEDHVRHAHAGVPASAHFSAIVLRQKSGGTPDHARDHRRRRPERTVFSRHRFDLRRHLHVIRHHGSDPGPQLGIGIGDVIRCSVDFPDNRHLPPQGARFLPASAHCDRQDQCISSGAHHGDVCCAALQPGAKKREEVRRDQQRTSSCKPGRNFGLFLVLSGDRTAQFGRNRVDHLVWRRKSYPGRSHAWSTCGFYSILESVFPTDCGHEREIQHSSVGDGQFRAFVQTDRHSRDHYQFTPCDQTGQAAERGNRIPERVVRLRGRKLGIEGRLLSRPSRRVGCYCRPYRCGKDDHHEPAHALLRHSKRRDSSRRSEYRSVRSRVPALIVCRCSAGCLFVLRNYRVQHPFGFSDSSRKGCCRSQGRQSCTLSAGVAFGRRAPGERAWYDFLGRTAPVARICARTRARSSNSDPGRGDVECRYGNRASDPAGDRSPDAGPHFNHHRASPVHDSALR